MNTQVKRKNIFRILFNSEIDVENYEEVVLPKELEDAKKSLEAKETEVKKAFNDTKSSFKTRINPKTEEAMRAMHSKVAKREQKTSEYEIGD